MDPNPADLAYGSLELAALEYQARRGEIILLYEDETILWRFALPRAGWWRTAQRARLPIRPLSQSQIKREESRKRQAWVQYRSWSRVTSGVLLSVIGAVPYGTSKVFYKIVPHFDAQELRQYVHQVMAAFRTTGKAVVMVVDRSGIHRAHKLDATLDHYHDKFRFHFLPAHCGHHLRFCRKVRFLGQNPKIGYQKFNDLQTAKISKKQLCDRTVFFTVCGDLVGAFSLRDARVGDGWQCRGLWLRGPDDPCAL